MQSTGSRWREKPFFSAQQFSFYYRCEAILRYWFVILLNVKLRTKNENCISTTVTIKLLLPRLSNFHSPQRFLRHKSTQLSDGKQWMNNRVLFFMAQRLIPFRLCSLITNSISFLSQMFKRDGNSPNKAYLRAFTPLEISS